MSQQTVSPEIWFRPDGRDSIQTITLNDSQTIKPRDVLQRIDNNLSKVYGIKNGNKNTPYFDVRYHAFIALEYKKSGINTGTKIKCLSHGTIAVKVSEKANTHIEKYAKVSIDNTGEFIPFFTTKEEENNVHYKCCSVGKSLGRFFDFKPANKGELFLLELE